MCGTRQPCAFLTLTIVTSVSIFVVTLLNMIFSIKSPKYKTFLEPSNLTNYDNITSKNFLSEIDFNETFIGQNTGFGQYGKIYDKCFKGYCKINSTNIFNTNCSDACLYLRYSKGNCYIDDEQCQAFCSEVSSAGSLGKCATYNKIYNWKGYQSKFEYTNYSFLTLNDTVPYNEECHTGYKQCGVLNNKRDKFCVKTYYDCPINKIVIKDSQSPPTDFNYTEKKIGNKYIYYTKESINNFVYMGFFAESDGYNNYEKYAPYSEVVDTDTFYNFIQNNPFLYDGQYSKSSEAELSQKGYAYLKLFKDKTMTSLEDLKKKQEIYNKHKALYSNKTLEEENSSIIAKNYVLMGCGIGAFSYFFLFIPFFTPLYMNDSDCGARRGEIGDLCCCRNMSPCKNTTLFFCLCLPTVISILISFIIVCINKVIFNTYSNQEYIEEYYTYYYDFFERTKYYVFEENKFYNSAQFVCLLLAIIFMIIHPILIFLIYGFSHPVKYVEAPRKKIRSAEINTVRYQAPPTYIPPPPVYYQPPPPPHHHHHHPPPPPHGPAIGINFNSPLGSFGAGFGINLPHGFI